MSLPAPLFGQGDIGDWVGIVLVILFIVIPIITQMVAKMRQPQPPPDGGARPARPPAPQPVEQAVEDEIGEFLRRAARRGGAQQAPPPPHPAAQPVEAVVVREEALGDRIREQVSEHLDAGKFKRRATELGGEVAQADDKMGEHLHDVFDHQLSRLATTPGESARAPGVEEAEHPEDRLAELPPTAAAGLTALLSTPQTIRRAIVINEILQRPEHRWT